ncbi:MAG: protein YgfX [Pseudomonadota bacterium]
MKPVAKLSIHVRPSYFLKRLVWLAHLVAVCIVLSSNTSSVLQGALLLLIGISWMKHAGMASAGKSTTALILHSDNRIEKVLSPLLGDGVGDTASIVTNDMVLHPHTTVLPFLVILLYRQKNRLKSLVLLKDSLEAEDFRQLCLWLRWHIKKFPPKQ